MTRKWFVFVALATFIAGCAFPGTGYKIVVEREAPAAPTPEPTAVPTPVEPAPAPASPEPYHIEIADLAFPTPDPAPTHTTDTFTLADGSTVTFTINADSGTVEIQTVTPSPDRDPASALSATDRAALTHDAHGALISEIPERHLSLAVVETAAVLITVLREAAQDSALTAEQRQALVSAFNVYRETITLNVELLTTPTEETSEEEGPDEAPPAGPSLVEHLRNVRPLGLLGDTVLYLGQYPGKTDVSEWDADAVEITKYVAESSNGLQWGIHWSQSNYDGTNTTNGFKFNGTRHRWGLASRINNAESQAEFRLFYERRDDDGDSANKSWHEERTANLAGFRLGVDWFHHDHRWFSERNVWAEFRQQFSGDRDATSSGVPQALSKINYSEKRLGAATDVAHIRWNKDKQRLALGVVSEGSVVEEDDSVRALTALRLRYAFRNEHWTQGILDVQWGRSWNSGVEDSDVLSFNFSLSF